MAKNTRTDFTVTAVIAASDLLALENGLMEQSKHCAVTPADYLKCLVARSTVAIDGKVIVKTCGLNDPQSLHNGETCTIYNRKSLIREAPTNRPGCLEIADCHNLYAHSTALYLVPKLLGDVSTVTAIEQ
jgi:hypothetical protein